MICLGIEGTAHTVGVGIVDSDGNVLSDIKKIYVPDEGGIHPRESSRYMANHFEEALFDALEKAEITKEDVDLIAFSKGPGLGPCLGNAAVGARALSLSLDKPLVGVNHCVAHIEVGNMVARQEFPDWAQPLTLYVSGANTQIIMFRGGRYRVFGETLDIGTGNMLDKFGRAVGLGHPAGPKIETLGKGGKNLIDLPYVIKGNDLSFSGLLTESIKKANSGEHTLEDVCYSLQETSFSMLTEATERALCHLRSDSLLLTGGVANNKRLVEMVRNMAEDNGARFSVPKGLCGDNGAMIAWCGIVMHEAGVKHSLKDSIIDPLFRTDDVDISWARKGNSLPALPDGTWKGAEASLRKEGNIIVKERLVKKYRLAEIDSKIRKQRTAREPKMMQRAKAAGLLVPDVYEVDKENYLFKMSFIEGCALDEIIDEKSELAIDVGKVVRKLHDADIMHGDLTTSNMILNNLGEIVVIDFGLSHVTKRDEDFATDLLLLKKALGANHSKNFSKLWEGVLSGYGDSSVLLRLSIAEKRGRYLGH